jgi:hypothetical protein
MSNITKRSPCVRHSAFHDSEDSEKPINSRNSEAQLPNDNCEAGLQPVVSRNSDFYERLKPTHNSSRDYFQLIRDDHDYLQPISDLLNTRENAGSYLHASNESAANLQPVESRLNSCRQPANERPLCTNDNIRSFNIAYAEQVVECDQSIGEYDEIVDVAMVGFQPLDNTRSRSQ